MLKLEILLDFFCDFGAEVCPPASSPLLGLWSGAQTFIEVELRCYNNEAKEGVPWSDLGIAWRLLMSAKRWHHS